MFGFPSFLNLPWTLPSLPSISLPANIQRRFLSYVLKKALGRFVKAGGLDVERIQAQISEGWVEIEGLEVDVDEVNNLIPSNVPFILTSGSLSKVTARIPIQNLWSDRLSLTLDTISLDFVVTPPSRKEKASATAPQSRKPTVNQRRQSDSQNLAASVTSAADDFLHEELDAYEGAQLDRSIRQSLILQETDPFILEELPGAFPGLSGPSSSPRSPQRLPATAESTTVLAGLVERILARLELKVKNLKIRLRCNDSDHGAIYELNTGEVRYSDDGSTSDDADAATQRTARSVKISSFNLYMSPIPATASQKASRPNQGTTRSSSQSSASSTSGSSSNDNADMMMSQAVGDLRQSFMPSVASEVSMYESALDEVFEDAETGSDGDAQELSRSGSRTPVGAPIEKHEPILLLSFGTEEIVLRMTTTQSSAFVSQAASYADKSSSTLASPLTSRPQPSRSSTGFINSSLPAINIELLAGTIAAIISPDQAASIITVLQQISLSKGSHASTPSPSVSHPVAETQARLDARLCIKAIHVAMVYDLAARSRTDFDSAVERYWVRPAVNHLPFGHLKLRLEEIAVSYATRGYIAQPINTGRPRIEKSHSSTTNAWRSSSGQVSPRPPVCTLKIGDASIFELLASATRQTDHDDDSPPGGMFPVLIFDMGLLQQYNMASGIPTNPVNLAKDLKTNTVPETFPEFDLVDWRSSAASRKIGNTERAWKVRQKLRGVLKGVSATPVPADGPVIASRKEIGGIMPATIDLQPVHVFIDLSLVERLLPVLRYIAPVIRTPREHADVPPDLATALRSRSTISSGERTAQFVIDDLEAQASSMATLQPVPSPIEQLTVTCLLIRLDIRCPAPLNRRGCWGDGGHLRSGIVTLDIHDLDISITSRISRSGARGTSAHSHPAVPLPTTNVQWQKMLLFFCRVPDTKATSFLVIGPLAPDVGESDDFGVLLPAVEITSAAVTPNQASTQQVTCRVPSIQSQIGQRTVEGLQFFADDMTHWLDGAFGDGTGPKPRDDLKMIGSRFFGSKGSSSASSSAEGDDGDEATSATRLRLLISEIDMTLLLPRIEAPEKEQRTLSLRASDLDIKVDSNIAGRQETVVSIAVMEVDLSDRTSALNPRRIFGRTTPLSLTTHSQPILQFRFSSLADVSTGTKQTGIKIIASSATVFITKDMDWVKELTSFAKTPEGVFEDVVLSEVTRIDLQLYDVSAHLAAPTMAGAVVVVLGTVRVRTDIISDAEDNMVEIGASSVSILAVDDLDVTRTLSSGFSTSMEAWKHAGFAPLLEVLVLDLEVFRGSTGLQETLLEVLQSQVKIAACADSLSTFGALVGDLATLGPAKAPSTENVMSPTILDRSINVFDSLDENAFSQVPDIISGADLIDDDLPTNLDYLDASTRHPANAVTKDRSTGETLRSWQTAGDVMPDHDSIHGETLKILMDQPFDLEEHYWEDLPVVTTGFADDTRVGKYRMRIHDCSLDIFLHDGYDWHKTRKAIEDEIKSVRRRLQRIRQLLASGQKADDSVEQTRSVLFNSIYIGLEQGPGNMDSAALLAAIDEELEDLGAETASQSSWQTNFPPAGNGAAPLPSKKTRLKGRRLTRSSRAQIEFKLRGIKADLHVYDPDDTVASKVHVTVKTMEILDHLRTSTWKKFLTEMKADSRGNVRETDADMVRVELIGVRPSLPVSKEEELRFRLKILPLKLHVDQDALDFLERFASFSAPIAVQANVPVPPVPDKKASTQEPFFQHVEILPIELKLDYKPKRVDFAALREGKTIELMNFFHFEGAEMTLRRITLSGISGWSRLSNALQDIWTPDVKNNQLVDVISGVAPIRSVVNVGSGVADLILLPIEQYRKDGRLARGVQLGANSFVRSTAMEVMKLGARLATGTQVILEKAEGVLGGNIVGEVAGDEDENDVDMVERPEVVSRYANQPGDYREGVQAAYKSLSRNINSAAQTILAVPMEVYERSGDDGPLKAVVRAVPIAVLKPMIGGAEAVSKTLLGVRNSLDPEGRKEQSDKYK